MIQKESQNFLSMIKRFLNPQLFVSVLALALIFAAMLIYLVQRLDYPYYYDAANYWQLGSSFTSSGEFSLSNFVFQLRGYFFPLFLFLLKWKAAFLGMDAEILFAVYSAMLFALLAGVVIPWFFRETFQWRTGLVGRFVFAFLLFYFWRGHFLYPLTDFPALAFLFLGLALLVRTIRGETSPFCVLLVGLIFGALINIRPIYQVSLLVVFILAFVGWLRHGWKQLILRGILFILGIVLVLLPQFWINRVNFNSNTPFVIAKYYGGSNLYVSQVFLGMKYQKYETNVGDAYPDVEMRYDDPLFQKLPKAVWTDWTLPNYLNILGTHPLDMLVSYFRHTFNGLDVLYSTPYIVDAFSNRALFSLINYLVWFLCLYYFAQKGLAGANHVQIFGALSLLAPVGLAIPTAMEVRFFLPLYIIAYGTICYKIDYREFLASLMRDKWHLWRFVILGALWILACFTLSAGTMENLP